MKKAALLVLVLAVAFTASPVAAESYWELMWCGPKPVVIGEAYTQARDAQILNPAASRNHQPVRGLDGVAADNTIKKFQKSFEKEPPKQSFIVPVGGINLAY